MATASRETEKKYETGAGQSPPSLAGLPGVASEAPPREQVLDAEYYDTAGLRLLQAGITLRRRTGGDDAGWHLKLPAGPDSRDEIRLPLGRAGRRVPGELAALVRVHARGQPLGPVARITTRRQVTELLDESGRSLAEVAADEVRAESMGEATALTEWNEVEVELTGGGERLLAAADARLRRGGLRPAGRAAKLERALAGRLPAAGQPGQLGPRPDAAAVVLRYARAQVDRLHAADPQVRRDQPDAVHQMRVTARRLRSTLKSFRSVLRTDDTRRLNDELRWLGGVLGEARDAEVLAERLASSADSLPEELVIGPVRARLRIHFAPAQAAGRDAALKALDSRRYLRLLDQLDRLLADPPLAAEAGQPAAEVLPAAAGRMLRRVRRRMRAAHREPAGPGRDAALHEARKAAKDARYAAEAVRAVAGQDAKRFAARMKTLQSVLGEQHDAVVATAVTRQIGVQAGLAGESAFTFGVLNEREHERARALAAEGWPAWRQAARRKYRGWMR
ncbi:MAG TPA: CYTH and CHAD domain-containing protein [Streptosporangiaceae bacterium]|jgi:CHAD domain-containing protein